ncbi:MBL fold metallo-hydrolase [Actinosynnema sp. NPDC020468]|uniref:MBL fold metallo-hydrolase n=1 Tax=Actinosynnema sp. NPDC020468 TaxID=3154488 RepID=UPI0033DE84EF
MDEIVDGSVRLRRVVVGHLDTNCWIVTAPNAREALVVDPGDDPDALLAACEGFQVRAVVLTHAHSDHVLAVPVVAAEWDVPVLAHPADAVVWPTELDFLARHGHWDAGTSEARAVPEPGRPIWDGTSTPVTDGHTVTLGPLTATLLHTPGHTPGGLTVSLPGHLLTGDTLFPGGPGLTGAEWAHSSFDAIMTSVTRLLAFPDATAIHPGHGESTAVAAERDHVEEWRARGW